MNLIVFDGWWRLIRNFQVKNFEVLSEFGLCKEHQEALRTIINFQNLFKKKILRIGVFSKIFM